VKKMSMNVGPIKNVLFDLDGTLTDPREGITRCIQFALEKLGRPIPPQSELEAYIGPPLRGTFASLLESNDVEMVETAVRFYRERFSTVGLFENELYADVPLMLESLRAASRRLFVATSKAGIYAGRILEHFGLAPFFEGVYGSTLEGRFDNKSELLKHLLDNESLAAAETAMVGDREHDVFAAHQNGIIAIGITYGYGTRRELATAGADALCDSPAEVVELLLQRRRASEG
jgi:phosphoglycolate phosphatase